MRPISPLRQRMLEDMSVRRFTPDTQREYVRAVKRLAAFLGRTRDTASTEELRAFQLHLTETSARPPTINATVTALRFFFKVTLDNENSKAVAPPAFPRAGESITPQYTFGIQAPCRPCGTR